MVLASAEGQRPSYAYSWCLCIPLGAMVGRAILKVQEQHGITGFHRFRTITRAGMRRCCSSRSAGQKEKDTRNWTATPLNSRGLQSTLDVNILRGGSAPDGPSVSHEPSAP
ncbi:hypothetical protein BV25DRAFT_1443577 [Artomyces pyxidatus]|uniref:Uncharacterized protein n=1 Tax=Artomyces pyxidatus TaxID=48021 RepID=A0ACB8SM56_9AGAM|nr:hypothetical protein BV25DRAFT_1443577 [Artomyces pyxidatus]